MNKSRVGALFFIGIDWAAKTHAVCVLDASGKRVAASTVEHSAAGFTGLTRRLAGLGAPAVEPVAIERPDGRLVDALLAAGHPVVPVKPTRSRPDARARWSAGRSPTPATRT